MLSYWLVSTNKYYVVLTYVHFLNDIEFIFIFNFVIELLRISFIPISFWDKRLLEMKGEVRDDIVQ